MQEMLLLAAVAAAFVYGWFLMGRLDRFLETNCRIDADQIGISDAA